jgi:hypothetical protein
MQLPPVYLSPEHTDEEHSQVPTCASKTLVHKVEEWATALKCWPQHDTVCVPEAIEAPEKRSHTDSG